MERAKWRIYTHNKVNGVKRRRSRIRVKRYALPQLHESVSRLSLQFGNSGHNRLRLPLLRRQITKLIRTADYVNSRRYVNIITLETTSKQGQYIHVPRGKQHTERSKSK
jgi:hypothetical protein